MSPSKGVEGGPQGGVCSLNPLSSMCRMHGVFINRDVTSTLGRRTIDNLTGSSKVVYFMSGTGFLIAYAPWGEYYYTIFTVVAL